MADLYGAVEFIIQDGSENRISLAFKAASHTAGKFPIK